MSVSIPVYITPPLKNTAWEFWCNLGSQADTDIFQDNPTLAEGDVTVILDGVNQNNIDTLPVVVAGATRWLHVQLSADELNGDKMVGVLFHDVADDEWQDVSFTFSIEQNVAFNNLAQADILDDATPFSGADIDAAISSRSTLAQSDILDDATPFSGANIDATISSRSTLAQSDILDDATPFSGANIDATISSRSDGTLVTLADSAITSAKYDESTAFPVKNDDSGATKIARTGADSDTLETLSDQMDVVQADLDNPDQYKADVSGLATAANVWAYSYRTLTEDATGNSYSVGNDKTVYKYSTIIFNLTLGNIDGIDDLVVTVKNDKNDTDESAIFQIRETTGLVYLWDTDIPTASDGTIVVTDAVAGNVIVTLKAASASLIPVKSDRYYDAKSIEGTESTVLATGVFNIVLPVTRTTV